MGMLLEESMGMLQEKQTMGMLCSYGKKPLGMLCWEDSMGMFCYRVRLSRHSCSKECGAWRTTTFFRVDTDPERFFIHVIFCMGMHVTMHMLGLPGCGTLECDLWYVHVTVHACIH